MRYDMEYTRYENAYVIRLDKGEELTRCLTDFCEKERISYGTVSGIGACNHVLIGLYDMEEQLFHEKEFNEAMEIIHVTGNISHTHDGPYLHLHVTLARQDLSMIGGHLKECTISATCELHLQAYPLKIGRKPDPETGLNIYRF